MGQRQNRITNTNIYQNQTMAKRKKTPHFPYEPIEQEKKPIWMNQMEGPRRGARFYTEKVLEAGVFIALLIAVITILCLI